MLLRPARRCGLLVAALVLLGTGIDQTRGDHDERKQAQDASTAPPEPKKSYFNTVRKQWGRIVRIVPPSSAPSGQRSGEPVIRFQLDGKTTELNLPLLVASEIFWHGVHSELARFSPGQRAWFWIDVSSKGEPQALRGLMDEPSESILHASWYEWRGYEPATRQARLRDAAGKEADYAASQQCEVWVGEARAEPEKLAAGTKVRVQQVWEEGGWRLVWVADEAASRRATEQTRMATETRLETQGLAATVTDVHRPDGYVAVLSDHETKRWARALARGQQVRVNLGGGDGEAAALANAIVHTVEPRREKTHVRLLLEGDEQGVLRIGDRVRIVMPRPAFRSDLLPLDIGRLRSQPERIYWFLNTIYCTCGIAGDNCAGHLYTLESCNGMNCHFPKMMAEELAKRMDAGKSDTDIMRELLKEHGPGLLEPHMLR